MAVPWCGLCYLNVSIKVTFKERAGTNIYWKPAVLNKHLNSHLNHRGLGNTVISILKNHCSLGSWQHSFLGHYSSEACMISYPRSQCLFVWPPRSVIYWFLSFQREIWRGCDELCNLSGIGSLKTLTRPFLEHWFDIFHTDWSSMTPIESGTAITYAV